MTTFNYRRCLAFAVIAVLGITTPPTNAAVLAKIEIREHLGFAYAPQPVHVTVALAQGVARDIARCALKDADGHPVLAQFKPLDNWDDGSLRHVRISFLTVLEPYAARNYTLDDSAQAPPDDGALQITRRKDAIVLSSPLVAVEIPALSGSFAANAAQPVECPPPINRIRGRRSWFGHGRIVLDSSFRLQKRSVDIAEDGPILKRAMVTSEFVKGSQMNTFVGETCLHAVEVTLCRGEELVRVKESFSFPFTDLAPSEFAFDFYPGLEPDTSVCRPVYSATGPMWDVGSLWDLRPYEGPLFPIRYDRDDMLGVLTPWAVSPQQWSHFACYRERAGADADLAGIMITAPERWDHIAYMSPDDSWKLVQNPHAFFTLKQVKDVRISIGRDKSLVAHFPLTTGLREWAFFAGGPFPRTTTREEKIGDQTETRVNRAAPRDFFKAKANHYAFRPLDRIKDWALAWPENPQTTYPRLYYTRAEFDARREKLNLWDPARKVPPLDDPAARQKLKEAVLKLADETVQRMAVNPGPPHHIASSVYAAANLADLLLGSGALTPEERARLRAKLAFMAYMMNWRGYWAPELGYAANPNMTSFCYDAVGLVGLLLADHPESENWIRACTTELDRELANWVSDDGAQIESLGYTRAAWHEHSMLMTALKHAGLRDYFRHPRAQQFFRYYFIVQTPPHPERGYQRTLAIIGNVFGLQAVDEFNVWARGLTDVDFALAGALQWMWKEFGFGTTAEMQGKTLYRSSGADYGYWFGAFLGLPPYKDIALNDPFVQPLAPKESDLLLGGRFRGFGAVLNAHFGGRKETKLYLREGAYYSHWDADQGGIVFWGKGAPLVLDHGYGEFHPWFHSRVNVNHMYDDDLGEVTACFAGEGGAWLQGDMSLARLSLKEHAWIKEWPFKPEPLNGRSLRTDWRRRIVFMKDADPDGPNYLVLRDAVRGELPTEWVLWANGAVADLQATPIRAKGKYGVDLLVYLLDPDRGRVNTGRLDLSQAPPSDPRPQQTLIHLLRPPGCGTLAVLYPALPQEALPQVARLKDGQAVKLAAGARTDWVFVPDSPDVIEADGIRFEGRTGSFSKRKEGLHYMADRQSSLAAEGLTAACTAPFELLVQDNWIQGRTAGDDTAPLLLLSGPVAARMVELTSTGHAKPLVPEQGSIRLVLPAGNTAFTIKLRSK
jgi:hypothetical protein